MTQKTNLLSRVRNVARDGADVTSGGRQAVPHLRASNRKCSAANSGAVNQRLDEAVAAARAKSSATWKIGNVGERAKVRRFTAVEDLVYHDGHFSSVQCSKNSWNNCRPYLQHILELLCSEFCFI